MLNFITPLRNAMLEQNSQATLLLMEPTGDPRKRKSDSANISTERRKVETKNVEQNVECVLGDTQLPNFTIITCNEDIHKFLQVCGCDKCFEKLTKHK